ncbi:MAG: ABC transporter substrate binding protein, partial [Herbinix sp.]|nr:ABC transporter substrate binding protein [Herbinix sp.]
FLGINDIHRAETAGEDPNITGIIEKISIKENIELALKFNPEASRIIAFVDNTYTGIGDKKQFLQSEALFPDLKFETINSSDYTFDELAAKIRTIGDDSILLYLNMYTDKNGDYYTLSETSKLFKQNAKVPVYRATVGGLGNGILGGKMFSFEESGKMAANMVLQVFHGTPIQDIDIITDSPNYYVMDYQVLKQFNLNMHLIPDNTIFINKKPSFYEQYKHLVWTVIIIISMLSLFILLLVVDNIKRRTIQKALKDSHDSLTQTNEELTATEEELRDQYVKMQEHSAKLDLLNERYELSASCTNSAAWELNVSTKIIYFSDNIQSIVGYKLEASGDVNDFLNKIFDEDVKSQVFDEFYKYKHEEKNEINIQVPIKTPDNNIKWIMFRGKGVHTSSGEITQLHGIVLDVTKMKEQELFIEHLAHYDYLTDLPNRLCFIDKLMDELELGKPLAIIMLDIDNFKEINDTLGHAYGDMLLKDISNRLTNLTDDKLFISRFGGDEFLILISDVIDRTKIEKYINSIQNTMKQPFIIGFREHYIGFSIGISQFPADSDNLHQLIMNADTAMYQVKHKGKNNYQFYNEGMQEALKERANIETILRKALKEDGFYLLYQPIVNVMSGEIRGFEALLRLKDHPIPPNIFIPIAESSDIILEIGRKVTEEAIAQIARWRDKGFPPKTISINFSSKQIKDYNYIEFLQSTLKAYCVEPIYLVIEITESILLDETSNTIDFLNNLRNLGLSIVMDDFGTGYSSINYLTYIPVDHIKLDKSLSDKFLKLNNTEVMNSIISLAHSLNLTITAEGVEEHNQYERLKEGGCDFIQGYYFSKPLEIDKANEIYNKNLLSTY